MTTTRASVAITECGKCHMKRYGFAPSAGSCPRCSAAENRQYTRWITAPHPDTVARAERGDVTDD